MLHKKKAFILGYFLHQLVVWDLILTISYLSLVYDSEEIERCKVQPNLL
jgi:hypothetical protein